MDLRQVAAGDLTASPTVVIVPCVKRVRLSAHRFEDGCDALAAADSHCDQGVVAADALELVQRFDGEDRSRSSEGVTQ